MRGHCHQPPSGRAEAQVWVCGRSSPPPPGPALNVLQELWARSLDSFRVPPAAGVAASSHEVAPGCAAGRDLALVCFAQSCALARKTDREEAGGAGRRLSDASSLCSAQGSREGWPLSPDQCVCPGRADGEACASQDTEIWESTSFCERGQPHHDSCVVSGSSGALWALLGVFMFLFWGVEDGWKHLTIMGERQGHTGHPVSLHPSDGRHSRARRGCPAAVPALWDPPHWTMGSSDWPAGPRFLLLQCEKWGGDAAGPERLAQDVVLRALSLCGLLSLQR